MTKHEHKHSELDQCVQEIWAFVRDKGNNLNSEAGCVLVRNAVDAAMVPWTKKHEYVQGELQRRVKEAARQRITAKALRTTIRELTDEVDVLKQDLAIARTPVEPAPLVNLPITVKAPSTLEEQPIVIGNQVWLPDEQKEAPGPVSLPVIEEAPPDKPKKMKSDYFITPHSVSTIKEIKELIGEGKTGKQVASIVGVSNSFVTRVRQGKVTTEGRSN